MFFHPFKCMGPVERGPELARQKNLKRKGKEKKGGKKKKEKKRKKEEDVAKALKP